MTLAVEIAVGSSAQIALLVGAGGRPLFVRDRPADDAALQRVRDRGDCPVGAGDHMGSSTARATGWKACN